MVVLANSLEAQIIGAGGGNQAARSSADVSRG